MLWVVQSNLFREDGHARLLAALERLGVPYLQVEVRAFTDALFVPGTDEEIEIPPVAVWAMGGYKLARILAESGRTPGAYIQGLRADQLPWAAEHQLNAYAWTGTIREAPAQLYGAAAFVRPVEDSKAFSGKVLRADEYPSWREFALSCGPKDPVNGDTQVVLAKVQDIYTETRFWVVRGQVVTSSLYKLGGRPCFSAAAVPDEVAAFAQARAREGGPNPAYVLDVAETPDGPKIVECNCLNASGFYAGDMQKLVAAIEEAHR